MTNEESKPPVTPDGDILVRVAAETLPFFVKGLTGESASQATISILRHTDLEAVAITSGRSLLAFSGHDREGELDALGKEITEALMSGKVTSLDRPGDIISAEATLQRGIIAPIRVRGRVIGSLILAFRGPAENRREKEKLALSLARLLGAQIESGPGSYVPPAIEPDGKMAADAIQALTKSLLAFCNTDPITAGHFFRGALSMLQAIAVPESKSLESVPPGDHLSSDFSGLHVQQALGRLPVERSGRTVLLDFDAIVFAQVRGGHFFVNTHDESYHVRFSLRELEKRLASPYFFRCHRSFLVNLHQVDEVLPMFNGTYILYVKDLKKSEIPVSRQQAKQLRDLLGL